MDYIVNYNVSNVNIHCVIQEKDAIIARQQKEIEELRKANQVLAKDNDKLKNDIDLQKKMNEALEKFKYSLERNVAVLKEYDKNRWSISDAESEVKIWEHEYLMIKKMLEKREREEAIALNVANNVANAGQSSAMSAKQSTPRRASHKPKIADDGSAIKRYVCDYPNCGYRSNWAHDLKGHKRKHTGEKPYTCGWLNCNKSFRDLRDLKRHQRAHTGDKRYSCDWPGCDYRSTDVANLAKHKRTHTGEKPYKCDWSGCEACFADGSHLRRHQKKHENQVAKLSKATPTMKKRQLSKMPKVIKIRQQPGRKAKGSNSIPLEVILDETGDEATNEQNLMKKVKSNEEQNVSDIDMKNSVIQECFSNNDEKVEPKCGAISRISSIINDNNINMSDVNNDNNSMNDNFISVTTLTNVEVIHSPQTEQRLSLESESNGSPAGDRNGIQRELRTGIIMHNNNQQLEETEESEQIVIRSMEPMRSMRLDNYHCSENDFERVQVVNSNLHVSENSSYLGINSVIQINNSIRDKDV